MKSTCSDTSRSVAKAFAALFIGLSVCVTCYAADSNNPDVNHYAFANYIGSGIYRASGQNAAVVNIPFAFDIEESEDHVLTLRLPISLGFLIILSAIFLKVNYLTMLVP
ncbi:hypothetical protein [Shewanella sp. ENK2]|uniref:hypothetical protein n=1 Tax=Shewanella sp. ENK2 TaxID=2775245 RepID=UPI003748D9B7